MRRGAGSAGDVRARSRGAASRRRGVNGGRRVFEDEGNDVLQLLAQVLRRGRAGRRIVGPPSTKRRRELGMELGHVWSEAVEHGQG